MRHSKAYIQTHDLDWFGRINNAFLMHVASNGSNLPERVNDIERLHENLISVMQMPQLYEVKDLVINMGVIRHLFENQQRILQEYGKTEFVNNDYRTFRRNYLETFIPIALRGIITFDCTQFDENINPEFHMVCRPRNLKRLTKFPEGIEAFETENISLLLSPEAQQLRLLEIIH